MGPTATKQYDPLAELDALDSPKQVAKAVQSVESKKSTEKLSEKKNSNSGSSWFGGLFSKLAPKPKNQMILPDDNNPSVRFLFSQKLYFQNSQRKIIFTRLAEKVAFCFLFFVIKGHGKILLVARQI